MNTEITPIDSPATSPTSPPQGHGLHRGRAMWVTMLGCCLAVPLALIVGGVTAGGLAGARPWLLAIAGTLAVALVIVHRASSGPRCEASHANAGPRP